MRIERLGDWTVLIATERRERRRGLLGRAGLDPWQALRLDRCRSVHTFGMRFPIDVVMVDKLGRPITTRTLSPGRLLLPRRGVRAIFEVGAGRGPALLHALSTS